MSLGPPPSGLEAHVDHGGVRALGLAISEWEIRLDESTVIPLPQLRGCFVGDSSRSPGRYALVLKTDERTHRIGVGRKRAHLQWVADAIREAERTRARREGSAGREYLFERVVPEAVKHLIARDGD